jgi:hypothetical protein
MFVPSPVAGGIHSEEVDRPLGVAAPHLLQSGLNWG